jgi:hypothetical protein
VVEVDAAAPASDGIRGTWMWAGVLLLGIAAIAGLAFTPPGRAVAEDIGQLVGIGEPATLPPQQHPNLTDRGQPIVIASGRAPDDSPYEVVATRTIVQSDDPPGVGDPGGLETCLTADLPQTPATNSVEFCVGPSDKSFIDQGNVIDGVNFVDRMGEHVGDTGSVGPAARYELTGELSPNITRVDVFYDNGSGQKVKAYSDVGRVDQAIGDQIGTEDRLGYLIAFLPDDRLPPASTDQGLRREAGVLGTVEMVGYDASGNEVARSNFGALITRTYEDVARRNDAKLRLSAEVAAAEQNGELALNRSNVELCGEAMRAGVRTQSCQDVIHQAALRGLYGWQTGNDVQCSRLPPDIPCKP